MRISKITQATNSYSHRLDQFSAGAFARTDTLCLFFLHKFSLRLTDIGLSYSLYFFYLISMLFVLVIDKFSPLSSMHVVRLSCIFPYHLNVTKSTIAVDENLVNMGEVAP